MIDTVLFDIGGTLVSQTRTGQRTINHSRYIIHRLSEFGIDLGTDAQTLADLLHRRAEEYKALGESSLRELPSLRVWNEFFLRDFNLGEERLAPVVEELSFSYDYIRLDNRPRAGLLEMSRRLTEMGLRLGIVTNTISMSFAEHMLREYGVRQYYQDIVTSCGCSIRKPDARIFQYAMQRIGSTKERTCYVGDTISRDVLGSRNAELAMAIKVNNPSVAHRDAAFKGQDAPRPDYEIDRLDEIPQIIGDFNRKERTT